jgi:hypothetical protein
LYPGLFPTPFCRLLQDGKIVFFDLNIAEIFEPNATSSQARLFGRTGPPRARTVHRNDVNYLGDYMKEHLEDQQKRKKKGKEYLSRRSTDYSLLKDLSEKMLSHNPPTVQWLLDNHDYFEIEGNEPCQLVW